MYIHLLHLKYDRDANWLGMYFLFFLSVLSKPWQEMKESKTCFWWIQCCDIVLKENMYLCKKAVVRIWACIHVICKYTHFTYTYIRGNVKYDKNWVVPTLRKRNIEKEGRGGKVAFDHLRLLAEATDDMMTLSLSARKVGSKSKRKQLWSSRFIPAI